MVGADQGRVGRALACPRSVRTSDKAAHAGQNACDRSHYVAATYVRLLAHSSRSQPYIISLNSDISPVLHAKLEAGVL